MNATDRLVETLQPLVSRMRTDVCWVKKPKEAPTSVKAPLNAARLHKHVNGGPSFGAAFIKPGTSVTLAALLDFDSHDGASTWDEMAAVADRVCGELFTRGAQPIPFRSTGGRGIHLYLLWDTPQDAYSVRMFLFDALAACGLKYGTSGIVNHEVEVFPKQNYVPEGKFGNMAVLPLSGESVPLDLLAGLAPLPKDAPFDWSSSPAVPVREAPVRELSVAEPSVELQHLKAALDAIPNDTQPLDYDAWRNVVFSIHHATHGSDEGLQLAHEFSSRSGKYDPEFLDTRVWPYIDAEREGGITDRYVVALAHQHGFNATTADDFEDLGDNTEDPLLSSHVANPFLPIPAHEFAVDNRSTHWLIHGVLPAEGVSMVYGASGSGKTFAVLDLSVSVAKGEPWRGKKVSGGKVVYVVAESPGGFKKRVAAVERQYGSVGELYVIPVPPNLYDKASTKQLIAAVRSLDDVVLIVLDTLARVSTGADENSAMDMGVVLTHAQGLASAANAAVLLVHHTGKDDSKGARGSSAIKAALDAELEVANFEGDRSIRVTKLKDGEEGEAFGFRLLEITLRQDEDGEDVTSCVVDHVDTPVATRTRRMGGTERTLRNTILDLAISEDGFVAVDTVFVAVRPTLAAPTEGKKDTRDEVLRRALRNLVSSGAVTLDGGKVKVL